MADADQALALDAGIRETLRALELRMPSATVETVARRCLEILTSRGDGVASHALAVLSGRKPEHVPIDDAAALVQIARLRSEGKQREAVGIVAQRMGKTPAAVAAIKHRLYRKLRKRDTKGCQFSKAS